MTVRIMQEMLMHNERLTFVETPLEVLQVPQLCISRCASLQGCHFVPKLRIDGRLLCDLEKHVAEQTGCRVASSKQDVDELFPDPRLVCSLLCHLVDEVVLLILASSRTFLRFQLLSKLERMVDKLFNIRMARLDGSFALGVLPETIKDSVPEAGGNIVLCIVECFAEKGVFVVRLVLAEGAECVGGVIEKELGGRVHGQAEEQLLQINSGPISWNVLQHELEVALKGLEVSNLVSGKVGAQEMTAVSPSLSVGVEDAVAE